MFHAGDRMDMFVSDCIPNSLPQIKEKVTSKLLDVNRELAKLPDIPENPELEVRRSLADFASRIKATLEGASLSPLWGDVVQQFRHEILDLKPRYIVKTELSPPNRTDMNGRIDLTQGDESIGSTFSSKVPHDARRRRLDEYLEGPDPHGPSTPSKRQRGEGPMKAEMQSECSSTLKLRSKSRSLQEVRTVIASKSKPGMPGIVTEDVYNSLCMEAVRPWKGPLQQLLDRTYRLLDTTLHQLLCEAFSNLRERLVFKKASSILKKFIVDQFHSVKDALLQYYALETRKFYTLDKDSLARHEHTEAKILTRHRHYYRMIAYLGDKASDRAPPRPWEQMAEEERAREDVRMNQEAAKLGTDPFKAELGVCAYVRGYYLTASTRFIDTCTLNIISGLIPDVTESLSKWHIDSQLGVFDGMSTLFLPSVVVFTIFASQLLIVRVQHRNLFVI